MLLQDQLREGYADECAEAIRTLVNKRREYLLGFRSAFVLGVGILHDEVDTIQGCLKELTGAEIRECCRKAYRLRLPLIEAAQYTVPVSRSAAEQIKALRQSASGKFLSASRSGVYHWEENEVAPIAGRRLRAAGE